MRGGGAGDHVGSNMTGDNGTEGELTVTGAATGGDGTKGEPETITLIVKRS